MAKELRCRDVGFDCDGVIRADTMEQALQMAAHHAREEHGLDEITPEVLAKVKQAIRDAAQGA